MKNKKSKKILKTYIKIIRLIFAGIIAAAIFIGICQIELVDELGFGACIAREAICWLIALIAARILFYIDNKYSSRFEKMSAADVAEIISETYPCEYCAFYRGQNKKCAGKNGGGCKKGIEMWLRSDAEWTEKDGRFTTRT